MEIPSYRVGQSVLAIMSALTPWLASITNVETPALELVVLKQFAQSSTIYLHAHVPKEQQEMHSDIAKLMSNSLLQLNTTLAILRHVRPDQFAGDLAVPQFVSVFQDTLEIPTLEVVIRNVPSTPIVL